MTIMTATLHIEHPVRDFDDWKRTFDGFHAFRAEHRVRSYRVSRRIEPDSYVTIDLDFDDPDSAATFHRALQERVWSRQQAADVLAGAPSAVVLNLVEEADLAR